MRKYIAALIAMLCSLSILTSCGNSESTPESDTSISTAEQGSDYVIRNVKWGMSMEEVKSAETAELENEEEDKSLQYKNIEMFGQKFDLVYSFTLAKGLHTAVYGSPNVLKDEGEKLEKSILETLTEKYGKSEYNSTLNQYTWYSNGTKISLYRGIPEESENLVFFRIWYTIDENADKRSDNGNL